MATEYERYEQECEKIRAENEKLLDDFADWLRAKGLSDATIDRHLGNIDLYVNVYLLEQDAIRAADGWDDTGSYLGYWYIRKVSASEWALKSNAASLKKFYGFMVERGCVEPDELADLKENIQNGMPQAMDRVERYNDPSITEPEDVWGL